MQVLLVRAAPRPDHRRRLTIAILQGDTDLVDLVVAQSRNSIGVWNGRVSSRDITAEREIDPVKAPLDQDAVVGIVIPEIGDRDIDLRAAGQSRRARLDEHRPPIGQVGAIGRSPEEQQRRDNYQECPNADTQKEYGKQIEFPLLFTGHQILQFVHSR